MKSNLFLIVCYFVLTFTPCNYLHAQVKDADKKLLIFRNRYILLTNDTAFCELRFIDKPYLCFTDFDTLINQNNGLYKGRTRYLEVTANEYIVHSVDEKCAPEIIKFKRAKLKQIREWNSRHNIDKYNLTFSLKIRKALHSSKEDKIYINNLNNDLDRLFKQVVKLDQEDFNKELAKFKEKYSID
jgi:hypothetical protein